eukprot:ctg_964.g411
MREAVAQALHSIEAQHGAEVPELPWAQDIMPGDEAVREWAAQRDAARSALRALEAQHGAALRRAANAWSQRQQLQRQARQKRRIWTARTGLILQEQLNRMTRVLRRLHYLDDEDVITTKGRTCRVLRVGRVGHRRPAYLFRVRREEQGRGGTGAAAARCLCRAAQDRVPRRVRHARRPAERARAGLRGTLRARHDASGVSLVSRHQFRASDDADYHLRGQRHPLHAALGGAVASATHGGRLHRQHRPGAPF